MSDIQKVIKDRVARLRTILMATEKEPVWNKQLACPAGNNITENSRVCGF
jgi:hypothetical protein